jgi:phosphoribosylformylglycinamidine synthase
MSGMFKAKVTVMFRKSILDPQGAAVERALKSQSQAGGGSSGIALPDLSSVRVGKVVELILDGTDAGSVEEVEEKVKILADRILANPVMEEYTVDVEPLP